MYRIDGAADIGTSHNIVPGLLVGCRHCSRGVSEHRLNIHDVFSDTLTHTPHSEPAPSAVVKQVPVGYIRTFTYQPLHFNPSVAQQIFAYPSLNMPPTSANSYAKMVNPLQYLSMPQKSSYTSASQAAATASSLSSLPSQTSTTYNGPLQAQQSVQQMTAHEPSPVALASTASISSAASSGSNGSNGKSTSSSSAPASPANIVSIAESLTSDEHLPVARDPMPLQQQPQQTAQQQMTQQQPQQQSQQQPAIAQGPFQASLPPFAQQPQQYTIVAPPSQPSPYTASQPRFTSAPQPNNLAASYLNDYQSQMLPSYAGSYPVQQQQQPYGSAPSMPSVQMPVQFVPCMCPVSYAYSPSPSAEKRSDNEQPEQQQQQQQSMMPAVTVTDYHQMMEPLTLVTGEQPAVSVEAMNLNGTDDLSNV